MIGLTAMQARCVAAIKRLTHEGVPPSYRELQRDLGLSSISQVAQLIDRLERRGVVTRATGEARSLAVTVDADILSRPTRDLRWLRDQIDRELRKRSWGASQ